MANILDYLDWRGDLSLKQSPFNEVDNLLLTQLAFVDFRGIVPEFDGVAVPLWQAAEAYFARFPQGEKISMGVLVPSVIPEMLRKMALSRRFGGMKLNCFMDHLDVGRAEQFAALAAELEDGTVYLAFRGTDDTLAGWKEDFLLACMPEVPAQKKAVEYVRLAAERYPHQQLRLGGHSKGGNLAVYSAVFCPDEIRQRIWQVYSNDGPGFHNSLLELPAYRQLEDRIISIVPRCSFVGMLLEHGENFVVVASDQAGFFQHDGFSWQVLGSRFIRQEASPSLPAVEQELQQWLRECPVERRREFVETLFAVLSASGAETLSDLRDGTWKDAVAVVKAAQEVDKETRDQVSSFVKLMFRSNLRLMAGEVREETERKTDRLKENLRQALEETTRKTEEKTEQLKESIRQAWEETEKKTEETVRKIGRKKPKQDEEH